MDWTVYALIAPLLWSVVNVMHRHFRVGTIQNVTVLVWVATLLNTSYAVLPSLVISIGTTDVAHVALGGAFFFIGLLAYFIALKYDEVSRIVPLWSLAPLFTLLIESLILDQTLSGMQFAAFCLILAGSLLLQSHSLREIFKPRKSFWFMLISALAYSSAYLIFTGAYEHYSYYATFLTVRVTEFLLATVVLLVSLVWQRTAIRTALRSVLVPATLAGLLISQFLHVTGDGLGEYALITGRTSLVQVILEVQGVYVLCITLMLRSVLPATVQEKRTTRVVLQKVVSIAMLVGGVVLLFG